MTSRKDLLVCLQPKYFGIAYEYAHPFKVDWERTLWFLLRNGRHFFQNKMPKNGLFHPFLLHKSLDIYILTYFLALINYLNPKFALKILPICVTVSKKGFQISSKMEMLRSSAKI